MLTILFSFVFKFNSDEYLLLWLKPLSTKKGSGLISRAQEMRYPVFIWPNIAVPMWTYETRLVSSGRLGNYPEVVNYVQNLQQGPLLKNFPSLFQGVMDGLIYWKVLFKIS